MRFSLTKLFVVVSGIAAVQAQVAAPIDLTTALPPCALKCLLVAVQTIGCNTQSLRTPCICCYYQAIRTCIAQNCLVATDVAAANNTLQKLCPTVIGTIGPIDPTLTIGPVTPTLF
ncbi:hypothetical protein BD779DRAFT_1473929 [Infundibulicybe gibba]|nr:hypothetical protein BD779DRAFT_1473929 [Infundibulicybe gibba]